MMWHCKRCSYVPDFLLCKNHRFYFRYYLIKMSGIVGGVGGDVCGQTYLCVEG